ncbi:MAG: hypothetical protein GXX85_00925 [Ignavibacteria bacterium]|nr:hypothetical protein [Ignavibacteria bacterium]
MSGDTLVAGSFSTTLFYLQYFYMVKFLQYTQKRVAQAIKSITTLSKHGDFNSCTEKENIECCKRDLEKAFNMLDFLIELHSGGNVDFAGFIEEYYKRRSNQKNEVVNRVAKGHEIEELIFHAFGQVN